MRLTDLLVGEQWNQMEIAGPTDYNISGLTADSHEVEPGFLFAALEGTTADGRDYIPHAMARGAKAILLREGTPRPKNGEDIAVLWSASPRRDYALLSASYWKNQPEAIAAVTGTNGKSSVVEFARQLWDSCGLAAASLGTLGLVSPARVEIGRLTTPDAGVLHQNLSQLASEGVDHLVLEASSHGLDQYRLDGISIRIAAFTNFSRDHIDYHGSMEAYLSAKSRLFSDLLSKDGIAVLNADDHVYKNLKSIALDRGCQIHTYGRQGRDVRLLSSSPIATGQQLTIEARGQTYELFLPLTGTFQVSNALCALSIVFASGIRTEAGVKALEGLTGVRGRMEFAGWHETGAGVYVDYAHTPDALRAALNALKPYTGSRLHLVFGCGGDRDQEKRAEMGAVAKELADCIVVTDDNPRSEDPSAIRKDILATCPDAIEVMDRRDAIMRAVSQLGAGDNLLVAGKGHEQVQIIGDHVLPFDDMRVCLDVLAGIGR